MEKCNNKFPNFCPEPERHLPPKIPCVRPVPSVLQGEDLYEAMNNLCDRVNVCINTYNDVMAHSYRTLRNLEKAGEENGAYYSPCDISVEQGYDAESGSTYNLIRKSCVDRRGEPIRVELGLAYGNTTNSQVTQSLSSASLVHYADKIFVAQPVKAGGWYGNVIYRGSPVKTVENEALYTVGFTRNGIMRVYQNGVSVDQMIRDTIENAMGCSGVLINNGTVTDDSWINQIPDYNKQISRVCMGFNNQTREVIFLTCGNENDVNKKGMTSKRCAEILVSYGCTTAVELCEGEGSGAMDKGQLMYTPDNNTMPEAYCFWYISRARYYRNDYERELANLVQNYGSTLWGEFLNSKRIDGLSEASDNLKKLLETETEERKGADTALGERITNETNARVEEANKIREDLTAETTARETADNNLQTLINNIQESITKITTSIENLQDVTTKLTTTLGLHNIRIEQNKTDIDSIKNTLSAINSEISGMNQSIDALTNSLKSVQTIIANLNSQYELLSTDVEGLKSEITRETENRQEADTKIGERISNIEDGTKTLPYLKLEGGTVTGETTFEQKVVLEKMPELWDEDDMNEATNVEYVLAAIHNVKGDVILNNDDLTGYKIQPLPDGTGINLVRDTTSEGDVFVKGVGTAPSGSNDTSVANTEFVNRAIKERVETIEFTYNRLNEEKITLTISGNIIKVVTTGGFGGAGGGSAPFTIQYNSDFMERIKEILGTRSGTAYLPCISFINTRTGEYVNQTAGVGFSLRIVLSSGSANAGYSGNTDDYIAYYFIG